MSYTAAVIGTGANPDDPETTGMGVAYLHGPSYSELDNCELVACADIVREKAETFANTLDIPPDGVYEDYETMLEAETPDIVSVCVPPDLHAPIVLDVARSGTVAAIHCEKPMAVTWSDAQRMASVCAQRGVQLTFNHQRRFGEQWTRAKQLLDDGEIGDLERIEMAAPALYDWGAHCIDLCNYFNDDRQTEWVIGQVDYREENVVFGVHKPTRRSSSGSTTTGSPPWQPPGQRATPSAAATSTTGWSGPAASSRLTHSRT